MICPYCGSDELEYLGIEDGGGDYGDSLTDEWKCYGCGSYFSQEAGFSNHSDDDGAQGLTWDDLLDPALFEGFEEYPAGDSDDEKCDLCQGGPIEYLGVSPIELDGGPVLVSIFHCRSCQRQFNGLTGQEFNPGETQPDN